jgi:hypothetical protein
MRETLQLIIARAQQFGLSDFDIQNLNELLDNWEFGLCLDTLACQLYENEIKIDEPWYRLFENAASKMKILEKNYVFLKELID